MDDMIGFLCGASFVIFLLAAIGHGLWLVGAWFFRVLTGQSRSHDLGGAACVVCDSPRSVINGHCRACGAPAGATKELKQRVDLFTTRRQLERWREAGELSDEECAKLVALVDRETQVSLSPLDDPFGKLAPRQQPKSPQPISAPPKPHPLDVAPQTEEAVTAEIVTAEVVAESPLIPAPPIEPPPPRRRFADMLAAFMEQSNIRWVEIISGMLVVICAVGLVISLRATLKDSIPYFPALSFMLVTAAIHFAGLYSLRRWNLKTTSRGVLVIATLLVPLSFLAGIVLSGDDEQQRPATDPMFLLATAVGLASFTTMNYFAARALVRHGWWRLMVAVIGTSFGQLLVNRLQPQAYGAVGTCLLLAVPTGAFLIATGAMLFVAVRRRGTGLRVARQMFLELGLAAFAVLAPVGLFVSKSEKASEALRLASPVLSLGAVALLAAGVFAHRRFLGAKMAAFKTTGTAIAMLGAGVMLLMVGFAWPSLPLLIAVGLVNFAALTALAVVGDLSLLHVPAVGCLALAYLGGYVRWRGSFSGSWTEQSTRLVRETMTGGSGVALAIFATITAAFGGWLIYRARTCAHGIKRRRDDGLSYLLASGIVGAVCIAIATFAGFFLGPAAGGHWATAIFAYFCVAALVANLKVRRVEAAWFGSLLLLAATIHGLWLNEWLRGQLLALGWLPARPILVGTLLHSVLMSVYCGTTLRVVKNDESRRATIHSGLATSLAALPFAAWVLDQQFAPHGFYVLAASIAWLAFALAQRVPWSFQFFQTLATLVVAYFTAAVAARRDWWTGDLFDPRHVQIQVIALAVWCIVWTGLRREALRRATLVNLWRSSELSVDQFLLGLLGGVTLLGGVLGSTPGILNELGFAGFDASSLNADAPFRWWFAGGEWLAVVAVIVALGVSLWEERSLSKLLAVVAVSATVPLLLAARWIDQQSVASAARWSFSIFGLVWAIPALWIGPSKRGQEPFSDWKLDVRGVSRVADVLRGTSLLFAITAVIGLTTAVLMRVAAGESLGGPAAESVFRKMGSSASYATPLAILVVVLFAYAVRESRAGFTFAASLVFQYAVSLACLLPVLSAGAPFDGPVWAKLVQWNAAGLAVFASAWAGARKWIEPGQPRLDFFAVEFSWLKLQVGWLLAALVTIVVMIGIPIWSRPDGAWPMVVTLGQWPSYAAIVLGLAVLGYAVRDTKETRDFLIVAAIVLLVHIIAATIHGVRGPVRWNAFHNLQVGWLIPAMALTAIAWWSKRGEQHVRQSCVIAASCAAFAMLFAIRGVFDDPARPWFSSGITVAVTVLSGAWAINARRQVFAYLSTVLATTAVVITWIADHKSLGFTSNVCWIDLTGLALVASSAVWLAAEVRYQRRGESGLSPQGTGSASHRFFLVGLVGAVALFAAISGARMIVGGQARPLDRLEILFTGIYFAAFGATLVGSLWDRWMKFGVFGLYVLTPAVACFAIDRCALATDTRGVAFLAVLAGLVALSGWVWNWGATLAAIGGRLGAPDPIDHLKRTEKWLPVLNALISVVVVAASTLVVLANDQRAHRVAAGCLPLLVAAGTAGLAQIGRRNAWQLAALLITTWAVVLLGWADIRPDHHDATILARVIRMLMAFGLMAFVYGVVAVRVVGSANPWNASARRAAVANGASAIVTLFGVLGLEWMFYEPGIGAPVDGAQIAAVSVVLVGLVIALLSLAVLPGRDPLQLTERGRMWYVYAAQLVAALLFAHLYLAIPELFTGRMRQYWPYIILAIAFAGAGVGELFQRLGLRVLAEPFTRSGSFMPLIPAIGMWFAGSETSYSSVLFVIGVLYLLLSFSQKSQLAGVAAAVAGNGGLWSLFNGTEDLTFARHPQFWLIPPALSAIVAAQVNRRRLSDAQLAAIRYVAMGVIYLSSSMEMLKIGIGESLWPPMILICLSLVGVAFGIAMQVRAYLYLGSTFVLVSLISMVAHASRSIDHSWPWWAFGIGMGLLLLFVFGFFESRRPQVMALIERLRQWEQ